MPLLIEAAHGTAFPHQPSSRRVRFVRIARERWAAGSMSPGREPNWSTLGFVLHGCLRLHRLQRDIPSGSLFWSPPHAFRQMEAVDGPLELHLCAYHDPQKIFPIPEGLRINNYLPTLDSPTVGALFQDLVEEALPCDELAHQACIHRMHLLLLAAQRSGVSDEVERRARAHFMTARQLFMEGWDRIAGVDEVAHHCGISHAWLCRLFKRYAACTPQQFWTQQRIRAAADLLWRQDLPLAEVAERIGFVDQFAFSKAFKRVMGVTPSTWLAQVRREG